ncbi:N-acetylmuramoyl-L-alanine amidase [Rhodobacteraceae bacterium NNCM2]|nr:N-acetylmuramoyl-L-alanine amidase [Coraliihabitans acroporae]
MAWWDFHVERPSPNFGGRRGVQNPDMIVIHYTGMKTAADALDRLCDPEAEVSAHFMIDLDGTRTKLVRPRYRAWHAGVSSWGGVHDVNSHSIGIELVNPGHGADYAPFPEAQMAHLDALLAHLMRRFAIRPERVVGHACIAPGRKVDPGEKFDWRRLAQQGLSIWIDPEVPAPADGPADAARFQRAARRFGYFVPDNEEWCTETLAVWGAFRDRFYHLCPRGGPTPGGVAHLEKLAERWPCHLGDA